MGVHATVDLWSRGEKLSELILFDLCVGSEGQTQVPEFVLSNMSLAQLS